MSYYLGFLLWPFGITLAALRFWDRPWSKNVFWMFCIFFGFAFIIAEEGGADSDRYARLFIYYAHSKLSLEQLWSSFYSDSSGYIDIASPLIIYLVSRVTANPSVLFAVFGLIFGYFYSRNIWYVLNKTDGRITAIVLVYILSFALINPIWNINGFRMWVAAQIFLFGTLPYLLDGNVKSLTWSGISVLFHFSFLFPFAILMMFFFLKNRLNIYLVFFIISAFIKEIDLLYVRSILLYLPDIFHTKIINYTNPAYAETVSLANQSLNWYIPFSQNAVKWVIYAFVLYAYFFARDILEDRKELKTLLCYSILLYGFANIFSLVPSGGRFIIVANTFMLAFIIIMVSNFPNTRGMFLIKAFSIPLLLLFCTVMIRVGMDFFGIMVIFGNPFFAALHTDRKQFISVLKSLL